MEAGKEEGAGLLHTEQGLLPQREAKQREATPRHGAGF